MEDIRDITELVKSGFIAIIGLLFIGIAIWIKTKEDRWNFRSMGKWILLWGMALILLGGCMVADGLADSGMINPDADGYFWNLVDAGKAMGIAAFLVVAGLVIRTKRIKENELFDMELPGKITDYITCDNVLPGYAQPLVEYTDPYSGESGWYHVKQDVRKKKYPIGSEYPLTYSREEHKAYEKKTNRVYKELEICCFGMAAIAFVVGIVKIVTGFLT